MKYKKLFGGLSTLILLLSSLGNNFVSAGPYANIDTGDADETFDLETTTGDNTIPTSTTTSLFETKEINIFHEDSPIDFGKLEVNHTSTEILIQIKNNSSEDYRFSDWYVKNDEHFAVYEGALNTADTSTSIESGPAMDFDIITPGSDINTENNNTPISIDATAEVPDISFLNSLLSVASAHAAESEQVQTIAPQENLSLMARFTPKSIGNHETEIVLEGFDQSPSKIIMLSGEAVAEEKPELSVSPESMNFGTLEVGKSSQAKEIIIKNIGNSVLDIDSMTVDAINHGFAGVYYLDVHGGNTPCNTTSFSLGADEYCTVTMTFKPPAEVSNYQSGLTIRSNDQFGKSFYRILLSGAGVSSENYQANISLSTQTLDFGSVEKGKEKRKEVKVYNSGYEVLVMSFGVSDESQFGIDLSKGLNPCGNPDNANFTDYCTFDVIFKPQITGTLSAVVGITSNDPDTPYIEIQLSGKGEKKKSSSSSSSKKKKSSVKISQIAPVDIEPPFLLSEYGMQFIGKILLKIQDYGKAYYLSPKTKKAYFLGRPLDAFDIMREQGIGITNEDLSKIPIGISYFQGVDKDKDGLPDLFEDAVGLNKTKSDSNGNGINDLQEIILKKISDPAFADKQKGKILLQIQSHGEAWYVNPQDGKRYFLGRPLDAFEIMRKTSLGISNSNFEKLK